MFFTLSSAFKKMCQISIRRIFSLGGNAQVSDLVHFLRVEKLCKIQPPFNLELYSTLLWKMKIMILNKWTYVKKTGVVLSIQFPNWYFKFKSLWDASEEGISSTMTNFEMPKYVNISSIYISQYGHSQSVSEEFMTNTTAASNYIPRRPRISINGNPPFQTFFMK